MPKSQISWKGETAAGLHRQVYARRVGGKWRFFERERRYDRWVSLEHPPLTDWLELLDAIRRRIQRRLLRPEEEQRVQQAILERFPGTTL